MMSLSGTAICSRLPSNWSLHHKESALSGGDGPERALGVGRASLQDFKCMKASPQHPGVLSQPIKADLHYTRRSVAPNLVRYSNLRPPKSSDLLQWNDLLFFLEKKVKADCSLEVEIDQYCFPDLFPPQEVLDKIAALGREVTLFVQEGPASPGRVYCFGKEAQRQERIPAELFSEFLENHSNHKALFEAVQFADVQKTSNLGDFLAQVIWQYNRFSDNPIPMDRRTQIYPMLNQFRQDLQSYVSKISHARSIEIPHGALYQNPLDTILRKYAPAPGHCCYSIGAGQMVSLLEFTRRLMDSGKLPLDYRLVADNRSFEAVSELNEKGVRAQLLNEPINTADRLGVYALNEKQRNQGIAYYQPRLVYLNLKAFALNSVLNDELIRLLDKTDAVVAMPAKAYSEGGQIPYLECYDRIAGIAPNLADRLVVIGGFYAAPKILTGKKVNITLAAKSKAALERMAGLTSPEKLQHENAAVCDRLSLKIIPSKEVAAGLMAGGANKNFLTYRSARKVLQHVLQTENPDERILAHEKNNNIKISEAIYARTFKPEAFNFYSPIGLKEDIRQCLPERMDGLLSIKKAVNRIVQLSGSEADKAIKTLVENIKTSKINDLGTRNARDGLIDETLHYLYRCLPVAGLEEQAFYNKFYPKDWRRNPQEGRNGIGPLLSYAKENAIELPEAVYEAWNLYHPTDPVAIERW